MGMIDAGTPKIWKTHFKTKFAGYERIKKEQDHNYPYNIFLFHIVFPDPGIRSFLTILFCYLHNLFL